MNKEKNIIFIGFEINGIQNTSTIEIGETKQLTPKDIYNLLKKLSFAVSRYIENNNVL